MNLRPISTVPKRVLNRLRTEFRWLYIRLAQAWLIKGVPSDSRKLIVFLTPGGDNPSGGVLSIGWIYQESIAMRYLHQADVVLCTLPVDPPFLKYSWFKNRNYIFRLESVLRRCSNVESLLLHIPEYVINCVAEWLASNPSLPVKCVKELHLNIMLQNIDLMRGQNVSGLLRYGKVTCTTAHEAYSNLTTRRILGVPLHRLSVCLGPELYTRSDYEDKEPLLVVSPDHHPHKERILRRIAESLPKLKIQIVQGLTYETYKELIRRAKWSLTFGEGLDGYFAEPVWSGGVSFAVFNDRFFTPGFAKLQNVYPSWEILEQNIVADMMRLDEPKAYHQCWQETYSLLADLYSIEKFRQNLQNFYLGRYTFP